MIAHRVVGTLVAIGVIAAVSACSSSASPGGGTTTLPGPPTEIHPPGDIPDNQAFVPYAGAGYRVVVPEGWARADRGGSVEFSDKYNSITITTRTADQPPTTVSARSELRKISATTKSFTPGRITTVQRRSGRAVLITYQDLSPVNPVTGKVTKRDVERYEFWRSRREVDIVLAAPVGSDNVDPWRKVTDGFAWTG
jgi:hypothetical protein